MCDEQSKERGRESKCPTLEHESNCYSVVLSFNVAVPGSAAI